MSSNDSRPRAEYESPQLRPLKLFVEAQIAGCCKTTVLVCSIAMKSAGASGQGKTNRTSTSS